MSTLYFIANWWKVEINEHSKELKLECVPIIAKASTMMHTVARQQLVYSLHHNYVKLINPVISYSCDNNISHSPAHYPAASTFLKFWRTGSHESAKELLNFVCKCIITIWLRRYCSNYLMWADNSWASFSISMRLLNFCSLSSSSSWCSNCIGEHIITLLLLIVHNSTTTSISATCNIYNVNLLPCACMRSRVMCLVASVVGCLVPYRSKISCLV